ncbi:3'-5' exonuclease [Candidatus Sulfidibacterium hydrothermale]|uniref:3'-5' exonuclease n=1 Tax=Candidatus Sulfidibacterium hydrothermale TaxID=2875962 RepID=UPI001F0AC7DC|nr:3'-5' exonuclease [Candidatus Sulfidibacterium hydrothermale]UBM61453.1 3'-5' exonuclease [Candidatus Sulfidibacterium hydrothermale]
MLNNLSLENILFLDIETVPAYPDYEQLPEKFQELWKKKAARLNYRDEELTPAELYPQAGIYAEFGKIVCVSCGFMNGSEFRIKSFYGDDERILLEELAQMLSRYYNQPESLLCAHNGKEFDFPYMARRMLINGITLPSILDLAGKKPWEIKLLDTLELWKFGDYKHYTSLELLAAIFNIPTPKDDINGSDVARVYWEEKDLERIVTYCQKDVLTTLQLFRRYQGLPLIKDEFVVMN